MAQAPVEVREPDLSDRSWTEEVPTIAAARLVMTDRAGRWVTEQVGKWGRTVNEVAVELGCDWHTVNDTVLAYGTALIDDDPDRIGTVTALGLDKTLFVRTGRWRRQLWCTSIVDPRAGRLLDIVAGRRAVEPCAWLDQRGEHWREAIEFATLDLSGPYRAVFDTMVPDAIQVADPFHLVKLANTASTSAVDGSRTTPSGIEAASPTRCRRLLTKADERLDDKAGPSSSDCCAPGDPRGEVTTAWHAKEAVRALYEHTDPDLALQWVTRLGHDLQDTDCPSETAGSVAPSSAGVTRSPPGTTLT